MARKPGGKPFATFSLHMTEDGTGVVAYEKDGVVEIERVVGCSCSWLTHPEIRRVPNLLCRVPGHGEAPAET